MRKCQILTCLCKFYFFMSIEYAIVANCLVTSISPWELLFIPCRNRHSKNSSTGILYEFHCLTCAPGETFME